MRNIRHQLLCLILGAGMAATLPAQVRPTPPDRPAPRGAPARDDDALGRPDRPQAQRRGAGGTAGFILGHRSELNLTEDQVKKLEALQKSPVVNAPSETAMMRLRADLMDATKGEGNIEAARAALDKISRAQNDVVLAQLRSRKDAREVLNSNQRTQLDQFESRNGRMAMGGDRGGMRGPMARRGRGPEGLGMNRRGPDGMGPGMMRRGPDGMGPGGMGGNMGPRDMRGPDIRRNLRRPPLENGPPNEGMIGPRFNRRPPPNDSTRPTDPPLPPV